jgi:hypothetical protein
MRERLLPQERGQWLREFLQYCFGGVFIDFIVTGNGRFFFRLWLHVYIVFGPMTGKKRSLSVQFLKQINFFHARTNVLL